MFTNKLGLGRIPLVCVSEFIPRPIVYATVINTIHKRYLLTLETSLGISHISLSFSMLITLYQKLANLSTHFAKLSEISFGFSLNPITTP